MREFKFRAWYYDQEKFDYGDFKMFSSFSFPLYWCKIQQFTGLLDSNKKEIYEGDILRCTYKSDYELYDKNGNFAGWSKDKKMFTFLMKVIWHFGKIDVNCGEYDIDNNGFAIEIYSNKNKFKKFVKSSIHYFGPQWQKDIDKKNILGWKVNEVCVAGNIFENPELLKN